MNLPTRSRRIGQRLNVSGLVLSWNTNGRRAPRWRHRPFAEADVVDVSISGAQFLAPNDGRVQVGQEVTIVAAGAIGTVLVRRAAPLSHGRLAAYGTEFVELEPPLEALLFNALDRIGPIPDDVVWR